MVKTFALISLLFIAASCKSHKLDESGMATPGVNAGSENEAVGEVKVIQPQQKMISDSITLSGTTRFLKKVTIESPVSGYVHALNVNVGDMLQVNETLATIETKEAAAYRKAGIDSLASAGMIPVHSSYSYVVLDIQKQAGDFVQEGAPVMSLVDPASIVVALNVPFELNSFFQPGKRCEVEFPGHSFSSATVWKTMPQVDSSSQTQNCLLKLNSSRSIPENLNVLVHAVKSSPRMATVLPKSAILTNETQNAFWVMKMISDSVAIKIPVTTGLQDAGSVEIVSPPFNPGDRILIEGNYGLSDTARVKVEPMNQ